MNSSLITGKERLENLLTKNVRGAEPKYYAKEMLMIYH